MDGNKSEVENLVCAICDVNLEPIKIPYAVIKTVTKFFAQVIGIGGFGTVYLGMLKHEDQQNRMVAVKKVNTWTNFTDKLFMDEITCLKKVRHENIVRLLGYCTDTQEEVLEINGENVIAEEQHWFLCFEYVPNGDLQHYLKEQPPHGYEWNLRYHIIKGICQGLDYLDRNCILHLDLKPANVLLGVHMVPKIADFGLSRLINDNQSMVPTENIHGTLGYTAPEIIDNGPISSKADIYSLGIIMIRLLTGITEAIPEDFESLDGDCQLMNRCIEIAQHCVEHNPCNRPEIGEVIRQLNEAEPAVENVPPAVNEPRNDPMSSLYQIVQRFLSLPSQALCEYYRLIYVYDDLDVLERILVGTEKPSSIPYKLLQFITKDFNRRIVNNDFGEFFKGILQVVAVIKLSRSLNISDKTFHQGVQLMITVQHENIVRFLGNCSYEGEKKIVEKYGTITYAKVWERLLCTEYLCSGSLESHLSVDIPSHWIKIQLLKEIESYNSVALFDNRGLQWQTRYQIIKGICKGLRYLRDEKNVTHTDLKPSSILLDGSMVPKITCFGMSTVLMKSNKPGQRLGYSAGYSAPERMVDRSVTRETDIYSLGVIILELVTGSKQKPNINNVLRRWKHRWMESLKKTPTEHHQVLFAKQYYQVRKCVDLAKSCLHEKPKGRPPISHIIRELNKLDNYANVCTFDQISAPLEPMLGIEPLEQHFPFELGERIPQPVKLTNDTDSYFAFTIGPPNLRRAYKARPNKGLVSPRSQRNVTIIILQPPETAPLPRNKHDSYQLYVLSTTVDDHSLTDEDVTEDLFDEDRDIPVDKVDLSITIKSEVEEIDRGD